MTPNAARQIVLKVDESLREGEALLKLAVDNESTAEAKKWFKRFQELINSPQLPTPLEAKLFALERKMVLRYNLV